MLTKQGLLSLFDRMKEAVERDSKFGSIEYEAHEGKYRVHARTQSFDPGIPDEEVEINAIA